MNLGYINIHTHIISNNNVSIININIFDDQPYNSLYSMGVHPWDADNDVNLDALLTDNPNYIAIGEIGLDKVSKIPYNIQINVFKQQIEIAKQLNKAVIIHNVKSTSEILEILGNSDLKFIFHGYIGNIITANKIIGKGGYISFGKAIFNHRKTIKTLEEIDTSKVFFETDNDNINIEDVYKRAAEITEISVTDWKKIITNNFATIFPSVDL